MFPQQSEVEGSTPRLKRLWKRLGSNRSFRRIAHGLVVHALSYPGKALLMKAGLNPFTAEIAARLNGEGSRMPKKRGARRAAR